MNVTDLITPDRIRCNAEISSKKRSLELLSELLATGEPGISATQVFDKLIGRERLGSTGLGKGVALPHARLEGSERTKGALITLSEGIPFDAVDKAPVDVLFALMVPEDCTDEHLQVLSSLAEMFSDQTLCERLRECDSPEGIYRHVMQWQTAHQST